MKWYQKLIIALAIVIFFPFIAIGLLVAGIDYLFQLPKSKKEYRQSAYCKDFNLPYTMFRMNSPEYRFYNAAKRRNLPIQYTIQSSNQLEYFVYENVLYLFPNFEQIDLDEEKHVWQVDCDGERENLEQARQKLYAELDSDVSQMPVRIIVERKMFPRLDLRNVELPGCIFLTWNYEDSFENEDSPLKFILPQTTHDLYEMMLATPDLCGKYEYVGENDVIHWHLYDKIRIDLGLGPKDGYFGLEKVMPGKMTGGITHWHPTLYEIYGDVCKIGKPGNVLIIRTSWLGKAVLYMGEEKDCPYSPTKKRFLRKMYYLKAE